MCIRDRPCPHCGGRGTIIKNPCKTCRGTGKTSARKTLEVKIPAGIDAGHAGTHPACAGDCQHRRAVPPDLHNLKMCIRDRCSIRYAPSFSR